MQKKLIALAVAAAAGSAFAQTNVTLYGIADVGVVRSDYQNSAVKDRLAIQSGVLSTSRLGFKGTEDLGNGLKALFTIETALQMDANNTDAGTAGVFGMNRQSFIGLSGGFGTVVAGRLQTTGLDFTVAGTALGASTTLGATNVAGGGTLISATSRANNAIAFVSPSFSGVTLAVNYARAPLATEAVGTATADKAATLASVSYANGPLTAGAVYSVLANNDTAGDDNLKEWGIRGGYDFGVAKVQATYQQAKTQGANDKDKKYALSVTVPVTAAIAVIGEYANYNPAGNLASGASNTNKAYTLAATYALSKRTTGYAGFVNNNPAGSDNNIRTLGLGVRHTF